MVRIAAADLEHDGAAAEASGLALHAQERRARVRHQVVARVLSERHENVESPEAESQHDGQRRLISGVLGMIHVVKTVIKRSDGARVRPFLGARTIQDRLPE
jgi:hypothetical protein